MINPSEEIPALIDAIRAGLLSLSEVQRSLGYVPDQILAELSKDLKKARDEYGLVLTVDASLTNENGGLHTATPAQPPVIPPSDSVG